MLKWQAIDELRNLINTKNSHAVLLRTKEGDYYTELHAGNAGNCLCYDHEDFVWRQEDFYIEPDDLDEDGYIPEFITDTMDDLKFD